MCDEKRQQLPDTAGSFLGQPPPPPYSPSAPPSEQGYSSPGHSQQGHAVYRQQPYSSAAQGGVPVQQGTAPVVIVQPETRFGYGRQKVFCISCKETIFTDRDFQSGCFTWLLVGGLAFFGCFLGCCLIPFCINQVKDVHHSCPNCGNHLGIYKKV